MAAATTATTTGTRTGRTGGTRGGMTFPRTESAGGLRVGAWGTATKTLLFSKKAAHPRLSQAGVRVKKCLKLCFRDALGRRSCMPGIALARMFLLDFDDLGWQSAVPKKAQ